MSEINCHRRRRITLIALPALSLAIFTSGASAQQVQSAAGATPALPASSPGQVTASTDLLTIPRVAERPLTADESPRIKVSSFELSGAVEQPSVGLTVAGVRSILDAAVRSQPEAGYTILDLEAIADKVTEHYRQKGLVVAKAFIPAQDVRDGKVVVRVLEGKLSAITVEGNKSYSAKTLLRPFEDLIGAPVAKEDIESALLTLTNYPGLNAFGVLGAGQDVGTTRLALRVQKEDRVEFDAGLDNFGSHLSGENRATLSMSVNNVFGQADRLRAYALYGFDTEDSTASGLYGGFHYELPIADGRDFFYLGAATNSYDIGNVDDDLAATEPAGDAFESAIGYRHAFSPSRVWSGNYGVEFQWKTSTYNSTIQVGTDPPVTPGGPPVPVLGEIDLYEDTLSVLRASMDLSYVDQRFRGVNQLAFSFSHGFKDLLGSLGDYDSSQGGASRVNATGQFDKFVLNFSRLQRLTKGSSLLFNVRGQYSSDLLVSLEQMSLTGPDAVRAFRVTERAGTGTQQNEDSALADTGVIATLEWIFSFPGLSDKPAFGNRTWGQVLQLSLFADYAHGELNDSDIDGDGRDSTDNLDNQFDVGGWGGSIQFNVPDKVFLRLDVAQPFTNDNPDSEDVQAYFRFGVHF